MEYCNRVVSTAGTRITRKAKKKQPKLRDRVLSETHEPRGLGRNAGLPEQDVEDDGQNQKPPKTDDDIKIAGRIFMEEAASGSGQERQERPRRRAKKDGKNTKTKRRRNSDHIYDPAFDLLH